MRQNASEPGSAPPSATPTPGTDHVREEENSLIVTLGERGFKLLFAFFGVAATLLSLLHPLRRERS